MTIKAGFMVPHPPIIIPEIGRGEETKIQKTIDAYHTVAKQIAKIKPDIIIFTSPHGVLYSDYFNMPNDEIVTGNLKQFGVSSLSYQLTHDQSLIDHIEQAAQKEELPLGTLGNRHQELDHGILVPLYFIHQYYTNFKTVRIHPSGLSTYEHYQVGKMIQQILPRDKTIVWVASGDLSHKLKKDGPYGLAKEGHVFDKEITTIMSTASFDKMLTLDQTLCHKAAECGFGSFTMLAGVLDGYNVEAKLHSYEGPFGVGYAVASFYPTTIDKNREFLRLLDEQEHTNLSSTEDPYIALAQAAVEHYVRHHKPLPLPDNLPEELLRHKAGVFVTIHKHGRLRGCIGTTVPTTSSVAKEIIQNAISSCSKDYRFSSVKEKEIQHLEISVDVLFPPQPIESISELDVKRYGVIVRKGHKSGLLLPNLDGIDTPEEQVAIAKRKAGIQDYEDVLLERFEVIRHE